MCPHSLKSGPCSSCLGAVAKIVSQDATTIDGQPSGRVLDPKSERNYYARRGGLRHGRRKS